MGFRGNTDDLDNFAKQKQIFFMRLILSSIIKLFHGNNYVFAHTYVLFVRHSYSLQNQHVTNDRIDYMLKMHCWQFPNIMTFDFVFEKQKLMSIFSMLLS